MPSFRNGSTTMEIKKKTYLRLEKRLNFKKESWDSVVDRVLSHLEYYESKYGIPEEFKNGRG